MDAVVGITQSKNLVGGIELVGIALGLTSVGIGMVQLVLERKPKLHSIILEKPNGDIYKFSIRGKSTNEILDEINALANK